MMRGIGRVFCRKLCPMSVVGKTRGHRFRVKGERFGGDLKGTVQIVYVK